MRSTTPSASTLPAGAPSSRQARSTQPRQEWAGARAIADRFARWFGDTNDFELIEAAVGEVGGRLHLHWRLRLRAERLGSGWFIVEQQAYADTDESGRIARLDLLCTGYRPEGDHD